MAKDTFYFSHDCNARSDRKIIALRKEMKMKGVGIYWCIVEMLYEENGYISISDIENIAFDLRVKKSEVEQVLKNFEMFSFDSEKFWSESVIKRLEERNSKSKKNSESANKRWDRVNGNANALRIEQVRNANKEKNSIVNESKEKKIHQEDDVCVGDLFFAKEILKDFGFNEIANMDKLRTITAFLKIKKSFGPPEWMDYFKNQYLQYKNFKNLSGEKRHNFTSFFGDQAERFGNGKWDEANWGQKIEEFKKASQPIQKEKGKAEKVLETHAAVSKMWDQRSL
jgi:Domain of unknown function (DUF4373)